jgi:hypothetical protein
MSVSVVSRTRTGDVKPRILTLTKQSWKKRRTRPGPLPLSMRTAARTMVLMRSSAPGQVEL